MQHFLYFFPLPHGQGSFLPGLGSAFTVSLMKSVVCSTSILSLAFSSLAYMSSSHIDAKS
jgi:hypothetical protein